MKRSNDGPRCSRLCSRTAAKSRRRFQSPNWLETSNSRKAEAWTTAVLRHLSRRRRLGHCRVRRSRRARSGRQLDRRDGHARRARPLVAACAFCVLGHLARNTRRDGCNEFVDSQVSSNEVGAPATSAAVAIGLQRLAHEFLGSVREVRCATPPASDDHRRAHHAVNPRASRHRRVQRDHR